MVLMFPGTITTGLQGYVLVQFYTKIRFNFIKFCNSDFGG